ncbi:MAG: exonuclease domain-containing protein [Steroidobacteraceae bacterium]
MDAVEGFAFPQDLVFVDLETTGGNAAYHRITEIGVVRVERGKTVEEWSSLVNPECRIPPYIERFTGISNEMVAAAPRFADIAGLVLEKLQLPAQRAPLFVAHNARFDYSFLRAEFRRAEIHFRARVLCTVKLSRRLFPEHRHHSLDALIERHELACSMRHRALGDARVLRDFWFKLRRELTEAEIGAAAHAVLGAQRLPEHLPADLADELPEGPGVYRFFGLDDVLLYVGKSTSLRRGVLAHFAAGHSGAKEQKLARQVRRVDWLETAGELGALLRETDWIRTQRPLYNRRLKPSSGDVTIRVVENTGSAEFASIAELDPKEIGRCCGVFRSHQEARKALTDIARARRLCLKVLGLERSAGSCIAYQLGTCRGACVGEEPASLHALRLRMALSSLVLKPWPFPGRVALRECDPQGAVDLHVLDHWTYLGTARSQDELSSLAIKEASAAFDSHVYRVLVRYLAGRPQLDWVDLRGFARPGAVDASI